MVGGVLIKVIKINFNLGVYMVLPVTLIRKNALSINYWKRMLYRKKQSLLLRKPA